MRESYLSVSRVASAGPRVILWKTRRATARIHGNRENPALPPSIPPRYLRLPRSAVVGNLRHGSTQAGPPQRIVSICTSFGLYGPAFFPEIAGAGYQPSEYLEVLGADLRDRFTVFSGISHPDIGGDHASEACFLTSAKGPKSSSFRNSVSLDYLAAKHLGNVTRFPFITLSTQDSGTLTHAENGAAVPALNKPSDIFRRMFLAGNAKDVEREIARLQRGQSILDEMSGNFSSLKNQLSKRDQQQVDDYAAAVRSMEKQLHASEEWVNKPKPKTDLPVPSDNLDRADSIGRLRVLLDLTKLALRTDSSRIVSVFIRGMDERPPIEGITEGHHGLTHHGRNPQKIAQLKIVEKLEMAAYRDFLKSLSEASDRRTGPARFHPSPLRLKSRRRLQPQHQQPPHPPRRWRLETRQPHRRRPQRQHPPGAALRFHAPKIRHGNRHLRIRKRLNRRPRVKYFSPQRRRGRKGIAEPVL